MTRYRPARWPYAVLALPFTLAVLGGAVWQSFVLFGALAFVCLTFQLLRADYHRRLAERAARAEADRIDAAWRDSLPSAEEAARIVADWQPPRGWTPPTQH